MQHYPLPICNVSARILPCHQEDEMLKPDTDADTYAASTPFETEFTKAFMQKFLEGESRWPPDEKTSAARLRDLNTFTRLLLSGAQTGVVSAAVEAGTMNPDLFAEVKGLMDDFTLDTTQGWPATTVVSAQREPWKSQDIDFRSLRMAEASVLTSRLIAASAMNPPGGGDDKVKFPVKPN
jgi:hypothetical protein